MSGNNEDVIFRGCQGGNEEATEAYREVRRGADEEANAGRREKAHPHKKHPCPDCRFCQWCGDDRCALCRGRGGAKGRKLSLAEQIALYEEVNRREAGEVGMSGKNLRLLGSERPPSGQPTVQEMISELNIELAKGEAVYTPEELGMLRRKLEEYERMLEQMLAP